MRSIISAVVLLLVRSLVAAQDREPSLGEGLAKAAPRAAGLAQVEVIEIKEVDQRPGDGPLSVHVRFRILRKTGATTDSVRIIKALGGHQPPNAPPFKPLGPVKLDTFKVGERYWVAFSSQYDWERYPQGVVDAWREQAAPEAVGEAVRIDYYAHRPQYDPRSGFTHSHRTEKGKTAWQVRMERDGKLLWEVSLPGEKFKGETFDGEWRLLHRQQWPSGLGEADRSRSGWFLLAETQSRLDVANLYQLAAAPYRLTYALEAHTGKTTAVWVSRLDLARRRRQPSSSISM